MENYSLDDSKLISLYIGGDEGAFEELMKRHKSRIYTTIYLIIKDSFISEDLLQETFIKAYRHISSFDGRSNVSTWLYRIATNEAQMLIRRKRPDSISFEEPSVIETEPQEPLQIVDWCCLPEEEFLTAESRARLDEAVNRLPPSLRVAFVLRDIEGLSTRETAEVLNISEVAVKTRLSRARLRLREDLSAYFGKVLGKG